jgi:hypothetical protein
LKPAPTQRNDAFTLQRFNAPRAYAAQRLNNFNDFNALEQLQRAKQRKRLQRAHDFSARCTTQPAQRHVTRCVTRFEMRLIV